MQKTVEEQKAELCQRRVVWDWASEMVAPIVEQHELKEYSMGSTFNRVSTTTVVDQHLDHIMRVADWLLDTQ